MLQLERIQTYYRGRDIMYKKKASLFIVGILLLSLVLTGCNASTLGFMNHLEEVQKIATTKATKTTSRLSVTNIKAPTDMFDAEEKAIFSTVNRYLSNNYISITQKSDPKQDISAVSIDLIEKTLNKPENLFTLNYKDNAFAFSMGPKFNEVFPGMDITLAPLNNKLIPLSTLEELLGDDAAALNAFSNPTMLGGLEKKSTNFIKHFLDIYKEADTDLITEQNGAFIMQMDTKDFIKLIDTVVSLSLKNMDAILDATITFMDDLTDEEFTALYSNMFPEGKAELVAMLKEAKAEFIQEGMAQELLTMWHELYPEISDAMSTALDGSSLRLRTWKEDNKYYTNLYNVLKITDPNDKNASFGTTILINEETQVLPNGFNVTMPKEEINPDVLEDLIGDHTPILVNEDLE